MVALQHPLAAIAPDVAQRAATPIQPVAMAANLKRGKAKKAEATVPAMAMQTLTVVTAVMPPRMPVTAVIATNAPPALAATAAMPLPQAATVVTPKATIKKTAATQAMP